ncbi:MAG: GNAT family N-acetyltransferase [Chelatococcus sp.]|uniref:GNAT family N-acetyltransferase n=1 Tax=Chelatococcus sp. TaxID=1953771 RepID=UPI0025B94267|nr:GNAT family N-acetyltransferase [Chelatococcus sp.]MBX3540550.1 GNAT family N-acetyltransferase [Chelatococcus sp.]
MPETTIRPVMHHDRDQWLPLWEGYNSFYERVIPADVTHATWQRFFDHYEPVHALVAERDGELLGLVHYIFHRNTSMIEPICYLQDLFTSPAARGLGIGRQLIEAVYVRAQEVRSPRVYWLTHETNTQAMTLYDKVAERSGFVQYRKQIP